MTSLRRGRILAMTLSLSVSFPALGVATAADRTIVASFASGDDFPTAYVLTFGGRSYRLDRKNPIAEIGYAGGRTRIVIQSLPSCTVVANVRAVPGGHYELVFGPGGFERVRPRGGFDAASVIPPRTEACGLPNTDTADPPLAHLNERDVRDSLVRLVTAFWALFGRFAGHRLA